MHPKQITKVKTLLLMSQNQKNQLSITRKRQSNIPNHEYPWPNLPPQLLASIARRPNLMQNITSFGCITKSWKSLTKHCNPNAKSHIPQLVETNTKYCSNDHKNHIFGITFNEPYPYDYYVRKWYKNWYPKGVHFKGHSHGHVVIIGTNYSDCYLWDSDKIKRNSACIKLPNWDRNIPFKLATLSSKAYDHESYESKKRMILKAMNQEKEINDPDQCCNVMVITGISCPAFAFCRMNKDDRKCWTIENCKIKEPYDSSGIRTMQFSNAIGFKGKFYALSMQGSLVVIEDIGNSGFGVTKVGKNRDVPCKNSRHYREYLVGFNEEILLVFLVSRKSIDFVDDVEVCRLDVEKLLWVKVESIGESALFLEDECCMGVIASDVGCRRNCIYFTHHHHHHHHHHRGGVNEWYVYDMEMGQVLSTAFGNGCNICQSVKN